MYVSDTLTSLKSRRYASECTIAYILAGYGLSESIITSLMPRLTARTVRRIIYAYKDHNPQQNLDVTENADIAYRTKSPTKVLAHPDTRRSYMQMMAVYLRLHRADPGLMVDPEALITAWDLVTSHLRASRLPEKHSLLEKLKISDLWILCQYLNELLVTCGQNEVDFGMVCYSDKQHLLYYYSSMSGKPCSYTGYNSLLPLKEIARRLQEPPKEESSQAADAQA